MHSGVFEGRRDLLCSTLFRGRLEVFRAKLFQYTLKQIISKYSAFKGAPSSICKTQWRTQKFFMGGGFQRAKIFLCTKIESMIRKNIKQAAIQYVNIVKQL